MTKWARVNEDGTISALYLVEPGEAEADQFVEVPDTVFADWTLQGGEWVPPSPSPAAVPETVTPRQMRLALHEMGLLPAVEAFIAVNGATVQIEWEYATAIRRDHPMWTAGAASLGKTEAEIDALFTLASTK